jgi:hypothetical protein
MTQNKFGLERNIDETTKRDVRQRCGFGCVICGCAIIEYHHFDPPFTDAVSHNPLGITLLCGTCHKRVESGIIDQRTLSAANTLPWCIKSGHSKDLLFLGSGDIPVSFGSVKVHASTILMYDDKVVIGLSKPECIDAPLQLNAIFTDDNENEILRIVNNEWQVGINRYDIRTTRDRLSVRDAPRTIIFKMILAASQEIRIYRLRMKYRGFSIVADKDSFTLTLPSGGRLNMNSNIFADIGIWMKSTGEALIAAGTHGGAAICMHP